jgi:hypothetical protein
MNNSQPSNSTSDPIAVKLLEADSGLETQETRLLAQLETIREKRKSLQVVIGLFKSTGVVAEISQPTIDVSSILEENHATPEALEESAPSTQKQSAATGKMGRTGKRLGKGKGTTGKVKSSAPTKLSAAKSKTSGLSQTASSTAQAPEDWQSYVRKEFRTISLPQAVLAVLERQPDDVMEVAKIIESVFVENIPKKARANIRARLSNVLSVGLKTKKWFRGKTGQYSATKEAAEASLNS